jgi:hypothetical protein
MHLLDSIVLREEVRGMATKRMQGALFGFHMLLM